MNVTGLSSLIANTSPVAGVIISVALMLFSGFAMTRLTKLARLPNVTGYILAGILIGPYVLNCQRGLIPIAKVRILQHSSMDIRTFQEHFNHP